MFTLYQSYGVDISTLFVTGFASSAVFSMFIGPLVDRWGRRRSCVIYCVLELIINTLEHFSNFSLLLLGRVLGGLSTALLFTAFESWMVTEHRRRGFPESLLEDTFGLATFGNGIMAVVAGVLAQIASDFLGEIGPFQLAIALTGLGLVVLWSSWTENFGGGDVEDDDEGVQRAPTVGRALAVATSDRGVLLAGLVQSLFEGAMYTFVFNWVPTLQMNTPALSAGGTCVAQCAFSRIQGLIFSAMMLCISLGGTLYPLLRRTASAGSIAVAVYGATALAALVPVFTQDFFHCLAAFLVLETCVGMFFVTSAAMRSMVFPPGMLSTVMNVFRVPLNVIVVTGTKLQGTATVFTMCFIWFALSAVLQSKLRRHMLQVPAQKKNQ
eukprot:g2491.t1